MIAEAWLTMIFRTGSSTATRIRRTSSCSRPTGSALVDFGLAGKLTDDDLSKLTRLFIDAAHENIEVLPKRLADLGVRYPKEHEEQFVAELHEIYSRYYGSSLQRDRPDPGDPRGVRR